jgi:hypothetical protein
MRYLCPRHQQAVWLNPELAMTLWTNALRNGLAARQITDWQAARSFLGTAYEVALLYLRNVRYHRPGEFTISHLLEAGRPLADVLCLMGHTDEAEACLMTLHATLIQASQQSGPQSRCRALDLTGRCIDELASTLQLKRLTASADIGGPGWTVKGGGALH